MSAALKPLLLVEDDKLISRTLKLSLQYRGFDVSVCGTLEEARKKIGTQPFDIVILDVNLPDGSGYTLCQDIRGKYKALPVLMLTARVDEASAVRGIESGADDYVRKPFGLEELNARITRLLGRKASEEILNFGAIKINLKSRLAWVDEKPLTLFPREFEILTVLVQKAGEVVTRQEILEGLGESEDLYDRTIDSHVSHLRRKLKESDLKGVQITPVYGVGYRLEQK